MRRLQRTDGTGGAVDMGGSNGHIRCPDIAATDEAAQLTIAFWANMDTRSDNDAFCGKVTDANNLFVVQLGATGAGDNDDIAVAVVKGGTLSYRYTNSNLLSNGEWVHVTIVYDGSQAPANRCKVYINGQLIGTFAGGADFPTTLHDGSSDQWYIGWREDDGSDPIDGKMDEFANTQNLPKPPNSVLDTRAIVITEGYVEETALFGSGESGAPEFKPAILRPVLRDLTIAGHDDTGSPHWSDHGKVGDQPGTQNPEGSWPDLYGGAFIKATGPIVENVHFFYIPGTALWVSRTGGSKAGRFAPWDVEKGRFHNLSFVRCYRGLDLQVIDAYVGGIQGEGLRDYGIKFTGGAAQIDGALHMWGVSPGPAFWFPDGSGPCEGGPFYVDNSATGILVETAGHVLGPVKSRDCTGVAVDLADERNTIELADLRINHSGAIGVRVNSQNNTITGGLLRLGHANAVGVSLLSGGNDAAGRRFRMEGTTVLGLGSGTGVAVSAAAQLNGSRIVGHFQNVGTALDLNGGIGTGNYIWITTDSVNTPLEITGSWENDNNEIWLNGVRQTGS